MPRVISIYNVKKSLYEIVQRNREKKEADD